MIMYVFIMLNSIGIQDAEHFSCHISFMTKLQKLGMISVHLFLKYTCLTQRQIQVT